MPGLTLPFTEKTCKKCISLMSPDRSSVIKDVQNVSNVPLLQSKSLHDNEQRSVYVQNMSGAPLHVLQRLLYDQQPGFSDRPHMSKALSLECRKGEGHNRGKICVESTARETAKTCNATGYSRRHFGSAKETAKTFNATGYSGRHFGSSERPFCVGQKRPFCQGPEDLPLLPDRGRHNTGKRYRPNPMCESPSSLPLTVESVFSTPVGIEYNRQGLQAAVCGETTHFRKGTFLPGIGSGSRHSTGRDSFSVEQKCDRGGAVRPKSKRLLQSLFYCEKERGRFPSDYGLTSSEQVPEGFQVQNAYERDTPEHVTSGGLVHVSRPERRIFSHKHLSSAPEVPALRFPGQSVPVPGVTLRPVPQSPCFCEVHPSRHHATETTRGENGFIHRRLDHLCRVERGLSAPYKVGGRSRDIPRFQRELYKERSHTDEDDRIYRPDAGLAFFHRSSLPGQGDQHIGVREGFSRGSESVLQTLPKDGGVNGSRRQRVTIREIIHETFSEVDVVSGDSQHGGTSYGERERRMHKSATTMDGGEFPLGRGDHGNGHVTKDYHHGCVFDRLGGDASGSDSQRCVGQRPEVRAHQLSRADGCLSSTATFRAVYSGVPCPDKNGQYDHEILHKQARGAEISPATCSGGGVDVVVRHTSQVDKSFPRPGCGKQGSGSVVQGAVPLCRVVSTQCGGSSAMGQIRSSSDRPIRLGGEREMQMVLLRGRTEPSGSRCTGTGVAAGPSLCVSPFVSNSTGPRTSESPAPESDINSSRVGCMEVRHNASAVRSTVAPPEEERPPVTGGGGDIPSVSGRPGSMGLPRERMNLDAVGLPQRVIDTIQSARAPGTRAAYDGRWCAFEKWCTAERVVPFQAPVGSILSFLQSLIDKGLSYSTLKVYMAAISACHVGFDAGSAWMHPLIRRFMKGALRLLQVPKSMVPAWDLAFVLNSLSGPPFEPLGTVDLNVLSLKTALLIALVSTKRVSDIHAFSVSEECTRFSADGTRVVLVTNLAFVPKNQLRTCVPVELTEFFPPPFASAEEEKRHMLCPVRALRIYMDRTKPHRKTSQLFVSWAPKTLGKAVTKARISQWLVEAIERAYVCKGVQPPLRVKAHSTRGVAASWALSKGVSIQDLCTAASWGSSSTFARYYMLDVTAAPVARAVLSVA